jgi:hypothetical protein
MVHLPSDIVATGTVLSVHVRGSRVPQGPQPFALVVTGSLEVRSAPLSCLTLDVTPYALVLIACRHCRPAPVRVMWPARVTVVQRWSVGDAVTRAFAFAPMASTAPRAIKVSSFHRVLS